MPDFTPSTSAPTDALPVEDGSLDGERLTILTSRGGDGLGLSFKVEGSGRVFRLEPTRDPRQPRFWCFCIHRCTSAGMILQTERSWWGPGGMTRAELPAAVLAIRADPNKWLADEELSDLRDWIMEAGEEPIAPSAEALRRARATRSPMPSRSDQNA
jgi:hypothetical protein